MPPTLWLLRHAPLPQAQGLCYGRSDWPADAAATQAAAQRFTPPGPAPLTLRTSPLQRCRQLAQALARRHPGWRVQVDERLAEMDFGQWEGRPWADIGQPAMDAWLANFLHARPGGDGESVHHFMTRVAQAWDEWRASGQDALWVTHAGVMRAALLLARGTRLPASARDWPDTPLPFGQAIALSAPATVANPACADAKPRTNNKP